MGFSYALMNAYRGMLILVVVAVLSLQPEVYAVESTKAASSSQVDGLKSWHALKQKNNAVNQFSIKFGEEKVNINIQNDKYQITDKGGKVIPGCKKCTKELEDRYGLGKGCAEAEHKAGVKICSAEITIACLPTECVYYTRVGVLCGPCE